MFHMSHLLNRNGTMSHRVTSAVTKNNGVDSKKSVLSLSQLVLPTGIHISQIENFGVFSKCLVYQSFVWYIRKILYIIGIFLSDGLLET